MTRLKTRRARIEADFANALAWATVMGATRSYRTVAARLKQLQTTFLPMLPTKSRDALELKRRIAEQLYQQAVFHGCSRAVCRAKFEALAKLGFTDLERKAHFHLLESRAALSRGNKRLARIKAAAIVRELERAPQRGMNPLRKELLRTIQSLIDSIPR